MGKLTTHVLDTTHGCPGKGIAVRLYKQNELLVETVTNDDGRCDVPLLEDENFQNGAYRLEFDVADYYRAKDVALPETPFLDIVSINFGISEDSHYHVPLLVSPYGYSTYRGS